MNLLDGYSIYASFYKYLIVILFLAGTVNQVYAVDSKQQPSVITGRITDENMDPLPGVNIRINGSTRGVNTDLDGTFKIDALPKDILVISFVGMETQMIEVGAQKEIMVSLKEKANEMEGAVIVAFGTQKKSSLVSSIESVKVSDLRIPASNLTTSLAGKIPGIISFQTSGEPGADNAQFFIRGVSTFGYKTSPLILIDGFEATQDDLARLQTDDIENFSILKDASATVLYGARGANGIIMVSTKPGREGPIKISARVDFNVAAPTRSIDMVDGVQYMKMYNEARITRDPVLGAYYSEQKIQSTEQGLNPMIYPNVDWYNELLNKSTTNMKANLNVSGGGQVATFYVSGGFENETGLLKVDSRNNFNNNIDIKRFNIRSNVIFKLSPTTTLDTRIQGRFERYTGPFIPAKDVFQNIMFSNPVDFPAVYEPDEAHKYSEHILFGSSSVGGKLKVNPYAQLVRGYEDRNESRITAQATLVQDLAIITKGLKFTAKGAVSTWGKYTSTRSYFPFFYDLESYNQITGEHKLFPLNPTTGQSYLGDVVPGRDADANYNFEFQLNWNRRFGLHSLGLFTVVMIDEKLLTSGNSNSIYETLPERNMGNSGKLTYDFDERYLFEFAYGYNGSEKFSGAKKFGFFPSLAFGWFVSNEAFWNEAMKKVISHLKIKTTWGMVGNDAIAERRDRFFYLSDIQRSARNDMNGYRWGSTFMNEYNGYSINRYANQDISWEVSQKWNLGLELYLFKDALKFQVDFFKDDRDKIYMMRQNFPATAGLEARISGNVGKISSKGIDGSIDYEHNFSNDFWMKGRVNYTYSVNKNIELDEKNYPDEYMKRVGHNSKQEWGLVAERLFVDEEEIRNAPVQDFGGYMAGDIKYKDVNGDGKVNTNDVVSLGFPTVPEVQYGFGLSLGYKQFDFSFFFQGNARVSFFINPGVGGGTEGNEGIAPFFNRRNALSIVADDYWSETNPNVHAFWPRLSTDPTLNNSVQSSWWLRDASFLRLKSVEMGYNLKGWDKIGLISSRVYLSMENLFVLSHFKLWDPEMGRRGLAYPPNRRFNIGLQLFF